jgi:uncharacterized membrane protein YuzA (DUF378 family)
MNCSFVDKLSIALGSIGAIAWGLSALGYDLFSLPFVIKHLHAFVKPLQILIGLSGLYNLVSLLTSGNSCEDR